MTKTESKISTPIHSVPDVGEQKQRTRRLSSFIHLLIGCGFLAMVGVLSSGVYWHLKRAKAQLADNSAYVELRIIDAAGQAVSGARVFEKDEPVGVTDSFGEWSKYGRFVLGETVQFRVTYRKDGKLLEVSRNFAMPLSSTTQVKFQATLQLGGKEPRAEAIADMKPKAEESGTGSTADEKGQVSDGAEESIQAGAAVDLNRSEMKTEVSAEPQNLSAAAPSSDAKNTEDNYLRFLEAGDLPEDQQKIQASIAQNLIPSLSSALEAKLKTSNLKLETSLILSSSGEPMLMGLLRDDDGKLVHGVVRGYMPIAAQSLSIFQPPLQWMVDNQGQFVSPRPGWQKQQLRILGKIEEMDQVFVGGYLAQPMVKAGSFTYYGETLKAMNVTVVRKNQIRHRARIVNRGWGNSSTVSMPLEDVARR